MTHFRNTFIFPEVKYPFKNSFVVSLKLFKGWWILTGCKCFYCSSAKKRDSSDIFSVFIIIVVVWTFFIESV